MVVYSGVLLSVFDLGLPPMAALPSLSTKQGAVSSAEIAVATHLRNVAKLGGQGSNRHTTCCHRYNCNAVLQYRQWAFGCFVSGNKSAASEARPLSFWRLAVQWHTVCTAQPALL